MKPTPLQRIYRLKTTILAGTCFILGLGFLVLARYVTDRPGLEWLAFWPLGEFGSTLLAAGLFGIAWDYLDSRDKEARDSQRLRQLLHDSAPDFRDAVIRGFAVETDDLQRVANPELLDNLATNALGLRLHDPIFAREIYTGLLEQAIKTPERWCDVDVQIRLSEHQQVREDSRPTDNSRGGGVCFHAVL
jgi:hypothetical protein